MAANSRLVAIHGPVIHRLLCRIYPAGDPDNKAGACNCRQAGPLVSSHERPPFLSCAQSVHDASISIHEPSSDAGLYRLTLACACCELKCL